MTIEQGDMWLYSQARNQQFPAGVNQEKKMTREEAVKLVQDIFFDNHVSKFGVCLVDGLEKLGVLKLEPKSVKEQVCEALYKAGYSTYPITILEKAGFKIVKE